LVYFLIVLRDNVYLNSLFGIDDRVVGLYDVDFSVICDLWGVIIDSRIHSWGLVVVVIVEIIVGAKRLGVTDGPTLAVGEDEQLWLVFTQSVDSVDDRVWHG
jgi:hypothetical protein